MGAALSISSLFGKLFGSKEVRILMLGLDAAGKTTILYKLKLNQTMTTIPTVGFNVETFTYKNIKFNMWDVGGQDKIRPLWRHYYSGEQASRVREGLWRSERLTKPAGTQGLVFVVDSSDHARIEEAKTELHRILNDLEMSDCLLLVFANKQDLDGGMCNPTSTAIQTPNRPAFADFPGTAMDPQTITQKLELSKLKERPWFVQPAIATDGEGLTEGFGWLSDNIKKMPKYGGK